MLHGKGNVSRRTGSRRTFHRNGESMLSCGQLISSSVDIDCCCWEMMAFRLDSYDVIILTRYEGHLLSRRPRSIAGCQAESKTLLILRKAAQVTSLLFRLCSIFDMRERQADSVDFSWRNPWWDELNHCSSRERIFSLEWSRRSKHFEREYLSAYSCSLFGSPSCCVSSK